MKDINVRLKKIIGQLTGITKMIDENQDCEKIIIQFQAVKAALDSAFSESLSLNLEECLSKKDSGKMKKILKLIIKN